MLCEKLESALEFSDVEIPQFIGENLSKELRAYQQLALKHFLLQRQKPHTNHLMFNMQQAVAKRL